MYGRGLKSECEVGPFFTSPTRVGESDRVYMISLAASTATTYTAVALPQMLMTSKDTNCVNLSVSNTGQEGNTGGGDKCW